MLFKKYLRLSLGALASSSEGALINAATTDLVVLDLGHYYIIHLFFEPLVALLYFFYFYHWVGIEIIWGFAIMILVILLQLPFASCLNKLRARLLPLTDT